MSLFINPIFTDRQIEKLIENHLSGEDIVIAHLQLDRRTEAYVHALNPEDGSIVYIRCRSGQYMNVCKVTDCSGLTNYENAFHVDSANSKVFHSAEFVASELMEIAEDYNECELEYAINRHCHENTMIAH